MPRALPRLGSNDGQTMAEYTVALGVISVAIVLTIGSLSEAVNNVLQGVVALL